MVCCVCEALYSLQWLSCSLAEVGAHWVSPVIIEGVVDEEEGRVGAVGRTLQKMTHHVNSHPLADSYTPHLIHSLPIKAIGVNTVVFGNDVIIAAEDFVSKDTQ